MTGTGMFTETQPCMCTDNVLSKSVWMRQVMQSGCGRRSVLGSVGSIKGEVLSWTVFSAWIKVKVHKQDTLFGCSYACCHNTTNQKFEDCFAVSSRPYLCSCLTGTSFNTLGCAAPAAARKDAALIVRIIVLLTAASFLQLSPKTSP